MGFFLSLRVWGTSVRVGDVPAGCEIRWGEDSLCSDTGVTGARDFHTDAARIELYSKALTDDAEGHRMQGVMQEWAYFFSSCILVLTIQMGFIREFVTKAENKRSKAHLLVSLKYYTWCQQHWETVL